MFQVLAGDEAYQLYNMLLYICLLAFFFLSELCVIVVFVFLPQAGGHPITANPWSQE